MQENSEKSFEPNTTQIPNIFLDYWMGALSHPEFKVLMAISRKTFGWHKKKDMISKKQIAKATGLHLDSVRKALRRLEKEGLIVTHETFSAFGDNNPNVYEIHVIEKPQNKDLGGRLRRGHGDVENVDWGSCESPTKDTRTKDTSTKGTCTDAMSSEDFDKGACKGTVSSSEDVDCMVKKFSLSDEQADVLFYLCGLELYSKPEVLSWWAKNYSFDRIREVYLYAKSKSPGNTGAYMNKLLSQGIKISEKNVLENIEIAKLFQEMHGKSCLDFTKNYIKVFLPSGYLHQLELNMEPEEFRRCLESTLGSLF